MADERARDDEREPLAETSGTVVRRGATRLSGALMVMDAVEGVGLNEVVEVRTPDGQRRRGTVLSVSDEQIVVQVFQGTEGLSTAGTEVRFLGEPMRIPLSMDMLGRILTGTGRPRDGGPEPFGHIRREISGVPINPWRRDYPREVIQTGVSALDGMNTLVRGQKLPIFSGSGLPHNDLAAQLIAQSTIRCAEQGDEEQSGFAVVFAGIGITQDDAHYFSERFRESGAGQRSTMFLNLASDPAAERIITPRAALTFAEYLAFDQDMHVLVILVDMTNYCEALRELSAAREEIPSRKGYPGYMYTDLASIYERSGRIRDRAGSITQLPILTMPSMDITHPVPDLTGYITEGQIVLSTDLQQKGLYPPVDVLPSLSRLMKDGVGEGRTRADHADVAAQLYAAYAEAKRVRSLAAIIGEEELTELDRAYYTFGDRFEQHLITQGPSDNRPFEETLNLGWELLRTLPRKALTRVSEEDLRTYYDERGGAGDASKGEQAASEEEQS